MGKTQKTDPIEQFVKYIRVIAWASIAVAVLGSTYLAYLIWTGQ